MLTNIVFSPYSFGLPEMFDRVHQAYDLTAQFNRRIVWVGLGSSNRGPEDLARTGVTQFVLIDNGFVERCNLGTQSYYTADIGKPKVEVVASRLRAINSALKVKTIFRSFLDIPDDEIKALLADPFIDSSTSKKSDASEQTVIVGATDNFYCQARTNAIALNFGVPSICCQHYQNAIASEITFTHPQTTRSCHRCILSSRFKAHLEDGYQNTVGSAGSPISSAALLNANAVSLILGMLHHGTNHPRWGNLLSRIGDRNLVQIRSHPDADEKLGFSNFSQAFAGANSGQIFFGEAIWRKQQPEHPDTGYSRPCPDCGGTGNLTQRIGTFTDTRIINP